MKKRRRVGRRGQDFEEGISGASGDFVQAARKLELSKR